MRQHREPDPNTLSLHNGNDGRFGLNESPTVVFQHFERDKCDEFLLISYFVTFVSNSRKSVLVNKLRSFPEENDFPSPQIRINLTVGS